MSTTPTFRIYIDASLDDVQNFIIGATENSFWVGRNSNEKEICYASSETSFELMYKVFSISVRKADMEDVRIAHSINRINITYKWIFNIFPYYQATYYTDVMRYIGIIMRQYHGDCTLMTNSGITIVRRVDGKTTVDNSFDTESTWWPPKELGVPYQLGKIEEYEEEEEDEWNDDSYIWH